MQELLAVGASFVAEALFRNKASVLFGRRVEGRGTENGARWRAYAVGHDDGADHACAQVALLA